MRRWATGWKADGSAPSGQTSVRVRYAETDGMGWVYYANYYAYFEVGRTELIRGLWRPYRELEQEGLILPVVESGCRYHRGARYDDLLCVRTQVSLPSPLRVRFNYRIYHEADDVLLAEGFTVHCFITRAGKLVPVPAELRERIGS